MAKEKNLPVEEHLEELRRRITSVLICILAVALLTYIVRTEVLTYLLGFSEKGSLIYIHPTEAFLTYLRLAILTGLVLSTPWILYQAWKFVLPALLEKEEKYFRFSFFIGGALFYLGIGLALYVILPFSLLMLGEIGGEDLLMRLTVRNYISFIALLSFSTGLVFELPLVVFLIVKLGFVSLSSLKRNRSYVILIAFTVAAFLTPTDWFSQLVMAIPLIILYEISILFISAKRRVLS